LRIHHLTPVVRGFGVGHRPTLPGDRLPLAGSSEFALRHVIAAVRSRALA
jgi:hypothetical protein